MPREARFIPQNAVVHVMCRGNNKMKIFHNNEDCTVYHAMLRKILNEYNIKIYHYCLMPNHVHLLLHVGESNLSKFMQKLNLRYCLYFKNKYQWTGHFWQDRFKSKNILDEKYLLGCGAYIELNPLQAGLVQELTDYRWSSYRHYAWGFADSIVTSAPHYLDLASSGEERQRKYRNFFRDGS